MAIQTEENTDYFWSIETLKWAADNKDASYLIIFLTAFASVGVAVGLGIMVFSGKKSGG